MRPQTPARELDPRLLFHASLGRGTWYWFAIRCISPTKTITTASSKILSTHEAPALSRELASPSDIACLRRHLQGLVDIADAAFEAVAKFDSDNHLGFMALNFAARQTEHARAVLTLENQIDAVLIARSMFEGLSQLLWAADRSDERPLRWRTFAFVRDWRTMRKQEHRGVSVEPDQRNRIEQGLGQFGELFLKPQARRAKAEGKSLPDDPYGLNWYSEKEKEIFAAVGAEVVYEELYGPFSEWHHWRVGGFAALIQFDQNAQRFRVAAGNPHFTASAVASAFQCLLQTLMVLHQVFPDFIKADLGQAREAFLAECGHPVVEAKDQSR